MKSFNWSRTYDADLINQHIAHDPAFFKIKDPSNFPDVVFLYCPDVGVFPAVIKGRELHAHACVLPNARGKTAVHAVRAGIQWVFDNMPIDTIRTRADRTKRHLIMFNALCFNRVGADDKYIHYEVTR